jgi:hypothetical protein
MTQRPIASQSAFVYFALPFQLDWNLEYVHSLVYYWIPEQWETYLSNTLTSFPFFNNLLLRAEVFFLVGV